MKRTKTVIAVALALTCTTGALAWLGKARKTTEVNGVAWFNQMDDAKSEATKTGKPILLLSMFGRIDEEMPCANARTLRATLFKSPEFKAMAGNDFVLAWQMVRPVPKVYIDLGNGKQLVRTVRGNACMYLCRPDGKVVDALPGVYTVKDFQSEMAKALPLAGKSDHDVLAFHSAHRGFPRRQTITLGKSAAESPTLFAIGAGPIQGASPKPIEADMSPGRRDFLMAAQMLRDMSLTPMPIDTVTASITGQTKAEADPEALALIILARDSANNIANVRPVVHDYFASLDSLPTTDEALDAVYADILKVPYKDPYLGLEDVLMPGTPK